MTGATGFLGSHLANMLVEAGYEVHVLIRQSSSLDRIKDIASDLFFYYAEDGLEKVFYTNKDFIAIIHAATCYGRNNENNFEVFDSNVRLPIELMQQGVANKVPLFVNTDSFFNSEKNECDYLGGYV
ncbi:NAD-dependent epimerase/dehydratase family protein, partial [Endozoicomonas arenosclerae]|uniref:NAD-dependent epimerase/dehydratase family protein n=1 Tax=Endozoicomonas arenosclerae TaxID=1633495 RepID=UPI0015608F6C